MYYLTALHLELLYSVPVYHLKHKGNPLCGVRGKYREVEVSGAFPDGVRRCANCAHSEVSLKHVGFDELSDLVIRPGIEEKLIPLALYRGGLSLADVQKRWNLFLALMIKEGISTKDADSFWDDRDSESSLCFPNFVVPPSAARMESFLSRLRENPKVTDNIKGFTEYLEWLCPKPFIKLQRISKYTSIWGGVSWRTYKPKLKKTIKWSAPVARSPKDVCYPFLVHDPINKRLNGFDLTQKINKAVPKRLPYEIRADVCQDLAVAILSGDMKESELEDNAWEFVKKVFKLYPTKWSHVSLDAPLAWADGKKTLYDLLTDTSQNLDQIQEDYLAYDRITDA